MLVAIDVGNTQTTLGLFKDDTLEHMWRISSHSPRSTDELHVLLRGLFDMRNVPHEQVEGAALATVVPAVTHMWKKVCREMFGRELLMVNVKTAGELLDVTHYRRADLGADRVADAVAARKFYGAPCIVVDFGTATNIEVIDKDGSFAGGIIAPGVESSVNALYSHAALLPQVEIADPRRAIGQNTTKAMQVGIVYGEIDRVDGLVHRVFDQLGYEAPVVATGGLSNTMAPLSKTISAVDPDLTLQGIRMIYEYQQSRKEK
ncbi:MAG: type III pantothenate kinase [Eggerthellaceae bacterium]|jgi:type III pantothenate kinase